MSNSFVRVIPTGRIWFTTLFAFFLFNTINAQNDAKQIAVERAKTAIQDLKEGQLVVILKSNQKKVKKLEELLERQNLSERERKNLQKRLTTTVAEQREHHQLLMSTFAEKYNFSGVSFMFDSDIDSLRNGKQQGYFLNRELQRDSDISLAERPFLVLKIGGTNRATTTGGEAMIIMDSQLRNLTAPFPATILKNTLPYVLGKMFNYSKAEAINYNRMVEVLNKSLNSYYNEVE